MHTLSKQKNEKQNNSPQVNQHENLFYFSQLLSNT
ncbi:MAG: hypothetical protein H6Q25_573 [Bacteroidetes bacterium]|nr:hypothetical protein [Bacteroidota bacterium]